MKTYIEKSFNQPQLDLAKATSKPGLTCNNNWRTYLKSIAGAILTLVIVLGTQSVGFAQSTVTITRASIEVEEGHDAVFMLTANPAPTTNLSVKVGITQTGDFVSDTSERTVSITSTMTTGRLEIATTADAIDEANGSVTATLMDGTSYTVGTPKTQTISILDNDQTGLPVLTITGPSEIEEGHVAEYNFALDPAPSKVLIITASVTVAGTFFDSSVTRTFEEQVVLTNGRGNFELPTLFDSVTEDDGQITVVIPEDDNNPPQFSVGTSFSATTIVKDNDVSGIPVVTIARTTTSASINESAGTLGHTITASAAPAQGTKVRVLFSQEGNFITIPQNGIEEYNLATSVPITTNIINDTNDEPNGSVTLTILSDTNDPPRYSVGAEATVSTLIADNDPTPTTIPNLYFDTSLSDTGITLFKPFEFTVRAQVPVNENLVIRYYISRSGTPIINGGTNNLWSISIPKGQSSASVIHTMDATNFSGLGSSAKYIFLLQSSSKYNNIQSQFSPSSFMEVAVKENNLDDATDPVIRIEAVASKVTAGQQNAEFRLIANRSHSSILPIKYGIYRGSETTNFLQAFPNDLEVATANILTGQTMDTIQVPTYSGTDQVAKESIMQIFLLEGANYAVIADGQGESATVTISNDLNISIAPKQTQITEGNMAEFVFTSSKTITRSLMVNVRVTQTGNYLSANALTTTQVLLDPTDSINGTDFNISLATRTDDGALTSPGTINVEVLAGTNYFVGDESVANLNVQDVSSNTKPVVTISRENIEVEEGHDAVFLLQADISPSPAITVMVRITQSGDFVSSLTDRPVNIANTQPVKLEISTIADVADESNGNVTAMILDDSAPISYTAGTIRTQTITILDNDQLDLPVATITAKASEFEEGHNAVFDISAGGTQGDNFTINASVTTNGTFFDPALASTFEVDIPITNGTGTYELATVFDAVNENDGSVEVTILEDDQNPPRYSVGTTFMASTIIKDNDPTGVPVVTIERGTTNSSITEAAGTLTHTVTAGAALASGTKVRVMFSQVGSFITIPSNGIMEYDLSTSSPFEETITTTILSNSMAEPDGSVTLTVLADSNATPRYSVGANASVTTDITDDDAPATPQVYFDTALRDTGISYLVPFELTVRSQVVVSEDLVVNYYISPAGAPSIAGGTNNIWSITIPKGQSSASVVHSVDPAATLIIGNNSSYYFFFQSSANYSNIQSQHPPGSNDYMQVMVKNNNTAVATLPVVSVEALESQVGSGERYVWFRFAANKTLTSTLPVKYRVYRGASESNFMDVLNSDLPINSVSILNGQSSTTVQLPSFSGGDQVAKETKIQVFLQDDAEYVVALPGQGEFATTTISNELTLSIAPTRTLFNEGESVEYLVTTSRVLTRPLTANIRITQTGGYLDANTLAMNTLILDPTLATNGTQFKVTLPTRALDGVITASGTVKYEILAGPSYHLGANAVADVKIQDANTRITISAMSDSVVNGEMASFELVAESTGLPNNTSVTVKLGVFSDPSTLFDETSTDQTLSLNDGTTRMTIMVAIPDDKNTTLDVPSHAYVYIKNPDGSSDEITAPTSYPDGDIVGQFTTGTIAQIPVFDNDVPTGVSIVATTSEIIEGETAKFQLYTKTVPTSDLTINLMVTDGSRNFIASPVTSIDIPANKNTVELEIDTNNIPAYEANGEITAAIQSGSYTVAATNQSAVVKVHDSMVPEFTFPGNTIRISEGHTIDLEISANPTPLENYTLNLTAPVAAEADRIVINTNIAEVSFPANQSSVTVPVRVLEVNQDERVGVTLAVTKVVGQTGGATQSAQIFILDNDQPSLTQPNVSIVAAQSTTIESASAQFQVSIDHGPGSSASNPPTMVNLKLSQAGTVLPPTSLLEALPTFSDCTNDFTKLEFTCPITRSRIFDVPTRLGTGARSLTMQVLEVRENQSVDYRIAGVTSKASVTIVDSSLPEITVAAASAEYNEGQEVVFTLTANPAITTATMVTIEVEDPVGFVTNFNESSYGADDTNKPINISFAPGSTSQIKLATTNDSQFGPDGDITLRVIHPAESGVANSYIVDYDTQASTTIKDQSTPTGGVSIVAQVDTIIGGEEAVFQVRNNANFTADTNVKVLLDQGSDNIIAGTQGLNHQVAIKSGSSSGFLRIATNAIPDFGASQTLTATIQADAGKYTIVEANKSDQITIKPRIESFVASVQRVSSSITEGSNARFEISLTSPVIGVEVPFPAGGVDVSFTVSDTGGNFIYSDQNFSLTGTQSINFTGTGTLTYDVRSQVVTGTATGSIALTVVTDPAGVSNYSPASAPRNTASVSVTDNGLSAPEISIALAKIPDTNLDDNTVIEGE